MTEISKDTLWKGIIEDLFEDFLLYFYPEWAKETLDFDKGFVFLDKELDQINPKPQGNRKRYADKLIKVFTQEGSEQWILIHVEVQGYEDKNFAERMFTYFYRIKEQYNKKIMALAIFTDANPDYQPDRYIYQYHKTENIYKFDTFKLLNKTEDELKREGNPFSIVMLTARKALEKKNLEDQSQLVWKKELVLALKAANYPENKIRRVLNFIRFYVKFDLETSLDVFNQKTQEILKERKNMGIEEAILQEVREKGIEQGIEKGIEQGVEKGVLNTKIKAIQKALLQGKLNLEEIADLFEVSQEFVLQVKNGEIQASE